MFNRFVKILPALAIFSGLTIIACFLILWKTLSPLGVDNGRTIPLVKTTIAKLTDLHPASLDDPEFLKAMEQAVHEPYIATLWLIGPEGRIVWAAGSTAQSTPVGQGVETLATTDTQRIIASLPQGTLDETSRLWLLAASAIRREGEHNDIYRHVLRPIQLSKDNQQAILGVAYLASDAKLSIKPWMFYLFKIVFQLSFLIYWLSIPLCVYFDAKQHGEWALVWAAFVLIGNVVALIAYILTRAPRLIRSTPPNTEAGKS
ncbi:MAG: hypothetical protein ABSG67_18130 [Thermoguttaceae bacterium]|jgi:hypothetical protein